MNDNEPVLIALKVRLALRMARKQSKEAEQQKLSDYFLQKSQLGREESSPVFLRLMRIIKRVFKQIF